jgi:hypothetical protein
MTDYTKLVKALRWCANTEICTEDVNCGYLGKEPFCKDALMTDAAAAIEALQAELNSRTIYGYSVDKLIMFAEMCKRNDVQEHDLKQAAWNLELTVRAVMNERQEIIKNAVGDITMRCTPDFEKAFKEMRDGANREVQE